MHHTIGIQYHEKSLQILKVLDNISTINITTCSNDWPIILKSATIYRRYVFRFENKSNLRNEIAQKIF